MTNETIAALVAACRVAGVDAQLIFEHFDQAAIVAYGEALAAPDGIKAADLHRWMASTAATIRENRCLCTACKTRRAVALVAADPSLRLCPSCRGACTSCGTCFGRGAVQS